MTKQEDAIGSKEQAKVEAIAIGNAQDQFLDDSFKETQIHKKKDEEAKGTMSNVGITEWVGIIQTSVLIITLIFLVISTKQQIRSTELLVVSTEQQIRSTKQFLTPNLGGKWQVEGDTTKGPMIFRLMITNYSDFPLYIKKVKFDFPEGKGWPQGYFGGARHIPPKGTEILAMFGMSVEDWLKEDDSYTKYNWPITIDVGTSSGNNWEVVFRTISPGELQFETIEEN
jgi:hypothetical protein